HSAIGRVMAQNGNTIRLTHSSGRYRHDTSTTAAPVAPISEATVKMPMRTPEGVTIRCHRAQAWKSRARMPKVSMAGRFSAVWPRRKRVTTRVAKIYRIMAITPVQTAVDMELLKRTRRRCEALYAAKCVTAAQPFEASAMTYGMDAGYNRRS